MCCIFILLDSAEAMVLVGFVDFGAVSLLRLQMAIKNSAWTRNQAENTCLLP